MSKSIPCRASQILQSVLRPTGLLALAESLSDKVWVTVAIALLFGAAALAAFAGKAGTLQSAQDPSLLDGCK